jgi:integrase
MTSKRDHGDGGIDQRGENRWRLRYRVNGKRYTKAFHGTLTEARKELRRLLKSADDGMHIEPDKTTIAEYLRAWLDADSSLAPKTLERYRQLAEQQIIPHLGATVLQNLRPAHVHDWHGALLKGGGANGRPLSARTVGHAHRVLHRALERALRLELVGRNVAHAVRPPKVEDTEIANLTAAQIGGVLDALRLPVARAGRNSEPEPHSLYSIAALALGTGMRRGELCGLVWGAVDLDAATVRVERSLEETKAGLRFKAPKTRHGRRVVSLPASVVDVLRQHRRQQLEQRLLLGLGRPGDGDLVFARPDGSPLSPDNLSRDWRRAVKSLKLPAVMFHALRHSHASALIAAGLDVVAVSRRIGHASPAITLRVYAHKFAASDAAAAEAIERALKGG